MSTDTTQSPTTEVDLSAAPFSEYFTLVSDLKNYIDDDDLESANRVFDDVQDFLRTHKNLSDVASALEPAFRLRALSWVARDCYLMMIGVFNEITRKNPRMTVVTNTTTGRCSIVATRSQASKYNNTNNRNRRRFQQTSSSFVSKKNTTTKYAPVTGEWSQVE